MKNTGRYEHGEAESSQPGAGWALSSLGKTGLVAFAVALHLCDPACLHTQSSPAAESWATDMVKKSIQEMRESPHFRDARELAQRSKKDADRTRDDLQAFLGERSGAHQQQEFMAVVAEYDLFISSSLPMATLRTYARDIDRLRREEGIAVRMVMRGFVGGMARIKPTIDFIREIITVHPAASPLDNPETYVAQVDIDPEKTLKITKVPALADQEKNCVVYGDSALDDLISRLKGSKCDESAGRTEKIVERDALAEIQEAAAKVDTAQIRENVRKRLEVSLENLPGQGILPPCGQADSRKIVPEAVLDFDVPDPERPGEVLYPKGYRFNPLDYGAGSMKAFMFAGDRPEEVAFVHRWINGSGELPASFTLLALGGDYHQLVGQMGRTVYSGIQFVEQGWCQATPCLMTITPGDNWIRVEEFVVAR